MKKMTEASNDTNAMINAPEGAVCIDKSEGITSHDVVWRLRKLYGTKQIGHTGTLDPMATGVLVVMIGRTVKASELLVCDSKIYTATVRLGITTDTEDTEGTVLSRFYGELPRLERVREVAKAFVGDIEQIPPMYSALKVDGHKLVDLARRGIEVERKARRINISSLTVEPTEREDEFTLNVACSKGTYIRTLCADIGAKLGCGAAMSKLRRTQSGAFDIKDAVTLEEIEKMTFPERLLLLKPTELLFSELDAVILGDFFARLAHCGCEIYQKKIGKAYADGTLLRLCDRDGFFAIGKVTEYPDGSAIKPIKQFRLS